MGITMSDVVRLDFGHFIRPGTETETGRPRAEPLYGYAFRVADDVVLFDTGMGRGDDDLESHYRPQRIGLDEALRSVGLHRDDIGLVVNCHLHFDHCGGNPLLAGRPVFTQRRELADARGADYTIPDLVDHAGVRYVQLDGEAEIAPDCLVLPTPGHTPGHQALAVRCSDGTVILAGQAHDSATDYSRDELAWRISNAAYRNDAVLPVPPAWIGRIQELDPARILFAHDRSVWVPT
jgi:N-acyl homoserine lactone hydrolase